MKFTSARITQLYQMLAFGPISTSPIILQPGAIKADSWIFGVLPLNGRMSGLVMFRLSPWQLASLWLRCGKQYSDSGHYHNCDHESPVPVYVSCQAVSSGPMTIRCLQPSVRRQREPCAG